MTSVTSSELKMVYFGLVFVSLVGVIGALYQSAPIPTYSYEGSTSAGVATSAEGEGWMSGLLSNLPPPLNDPASALVVTLFMAPVSIMLGYIAIRAVKDLVTQWI